MPTTAQRKKDPCGPPSISSKLGQSKATRLKITAAFRTNILPAYGFNDQDLILKG